MVGSRFINKAESNHAPIEGELLAVTYGLKKTRYYTLGSEKLTVCVDHKPLLGVLGETELEKIDNTRLEKLKEKTLGWRFRVVHTPGKSMPGTDALSRAPSSADLLMIQHFDADYEEEPDIDRDRYGILRFQAVMNSEDIETMEDGEDEILATIDNSAAALTWHRVREEVAKDTESQELLHWIRNGARDEDLTERLTPYRRHRLDLRELDGVPMLSERTIVPEKLRQEVLNTQRGKFYDA